MPRLETGPETEQWEIWTCSIVVPWKRHLCTSEKKHLKCAKKKRQKQDNFLGRFFNRYCILIPVDSLYSVSSGMQRAVTDTSTGYLSNARVRYTVVCRTEYYGRHTWNLDKNYPDFKMNDLSKAQVSLWPQAWLRVIPHFGKNKTAGEIHAYGEMRRACDTRADFRCSPRASACILLTGLPLAKNGEDSQSNHKLGWSLVQLLGYACK